jgi:ABC-2 type transport system ATP-binding protein
MITNVFMPDEGEIKLFGEKINPKVQKSIGYLPEERGLYKKLKVIEQLSYFGQLKGLTEKDAVSRGKVWLGKLDASDWENKKIEELSKGMQQKVQFISTILHDPRLLILDEPFSGFDPINAELLKSIITDLKKQGTTIILSTHIMEQAEQMCDDICLINKGKKVLDGSIREIKGSTGRDTIIIDYEGDDSFINELSGLKIINRTNNFVEFRFDSKLMNPRQILEKAMEEAEIFKFEVKEPSLREIFIDVISKVEEEAK